MPVAPIRRWSPDAVTPHLGHVECIETFGERLEVGDDCGLPWDRFSMDVTDTHTPVVVRCRGGLDFAYTDQLHEVLSDLTASDVVVDLCRLTFIDPTGLSALLTARRAVRDGGGQMQIRGARGLVRRVFEAAELADVLDD